MATDSRLTWPDGTKWDQAKKVYASTAQPFILSFCGDSVFATHALVKVTDALNAGLLSTVDEIEGLLNKLWIAYPPKLRANFTIYIGHREGSGMLSRFSLIRLRMTNSSSGGQWSKTIIPLGEKSAVLVTDGSGKANIEKFLAAWESTHSKQTSRAYYSAFADSIDSASSDPQTGGAPQLGTMYRIGSGRLLGIVHELNDGKKRRFFGGTELTGSEDSEVIEWRDKLFQRMDGSTKERLLGAQVHKARSFRLREETS